jgi:hypothetical protein
MKMADFFFAGDAVPEAEMLLPELNPAADLFTGFRKADMFKNKLELLLEEMAGA